MSALNTESGENHETMKLQGLAETMKLQGLANANTNLAGESVLEHMLDLALVDPYYVNRPSNDIPKICLPIA